MEYKTIVVYDDCTSNAEEQLKRKVEFEILNGWKPQGGVSISVLDISFSYRVYLAQAMVKND